MAEGGNWQEYAALLGGLFTTLGGAMIAHARSLVRGQVARIDDHETRLQLAEKTLATNTALERQSTATILEAISGVKHDILEQVGQLREDIRRTDEELDKTNERFNQFQRDEIQRLRQGSAQG